MTTAEPIARKLIQYVDRKQMRERGLLDETLEKAGIYTETNTDMLAALIGWKRYPKTMGPAIVLPFVDDQGRNGYCQIRPYHPKKDKKTGKPQKYVSPKGPPQPYFPFGVIAGLAADPAAETLITEGVFKALAVVQAGWLCIGLTGVDNFTPKGRISLLPELERIAWKDRPVFIAFDSDISRKPQVQAAESKLASLLTMRGACVKVLRIPDGAPDAKGEPSKQGIDDYLALQTDPKKAVRDLLNAAEAPQAPDPGSMKSAASEIDAVPEAVAFLDTMMADGMHRLKWWRGTPIYWLHGAYLETAISDVRGKLIEHLDENYCKLLSSSTNNVLDCVKAKARLPHRTEPPAWIDDPPRNWNPLEILATRRTLVHLPSFAEKKDDYAIPATPRFFTQNGLNYEFDPDAPKADAWLNFLESLWNDDPQSIATLQEWFGYCLLPDTQQQKICMLIGPPRSGKGTIARIQRKLIGSENVCGPTLSSLGGPFGLQNLLGKSLAIISDARLGGKTDSAVITERLLAISGEDAQTVDRKHIESVTCKLPTRLMFLSNELPRLHDSSGALANRMIILQLTESFLGKEDTSLTDRLLTELPGILLWAIDGWVRLKKKNKFTQPETAQELTSELADLCSPISAFLRERCEIGIGPEFEIPRKLLYEHYKDWCKDKGKERVEDEITFGRNLRAAVPRWHDGSSAIGDRQHRTNGTPVRFYAGIRLQPFQYVGT